MQEANAPDDEPVGPVSDDDWRVTLEPGNGSGHPSWRWAAHRRTEQGWQLNGYWCGSLWRLPMRLGAALRCGACRLFKKWGLRGRAASGAQTRQER